MPPIHSPAQPTRGTTLAISLILAALAPTGALAATSVGGTITDSRTHLPIAQALVRAEGMPFKATTNESGRYSLSGDRDVATLVVTRIGYQEKTVTVTDSTMDIELEPAAVEVGAVEVTGRAIGKPQLDDARATGTLTEKDLGRGNSLNLENSINTIPGVFMQSRTPWGGAHIQIRGYYPNYSQNSNGFGSQAFINQIPITDATGQTILDDVDFSTLGKVEVIKGPSSSVYGSAIGGTVNFTTARPAPDRSDLSQELVGGSDGLFRTNTIFGHADDHSALMANYGHQTYDSFRPNSRSKKDYAYVAGDFKAGGRQDISTYFSYNNSYEQLAGEIDSTDFYNRRAIDNPVYAANKSKISIESERAGFTHEYRFEDDLSLRSTFFGIGQTTSQPFAHGFNDFNRFSFGARSALDSRAQVGSLKLDGTTGGFFQRTNYTTNGFFIPASRPSDQENYAMNYYAFTEWNAALPGDFILTAGAALTFNEFGIRNMLKNNVINDTTVVYRRSFDPRLTPRGALLKKFGDAISIYGSVSTGFTPPALSSIINSDNTVNTSLKPESAVQYEVGSKGLVLRHKLSYDLALFDMEITDKLVSQRIGAVNSTTNAGKQRNRGAELVTSALVIDDPKGMISSLRPWLSYTYSDFKYIDFKSDANNNAATLDFSGKQVARVPKNVFNLGLDAQSRTGAYLFASYQHVDKIWVTFGNTNGMKPYDLLSGKLGWQRQVAHRFLLDVAGGGDNLLNSTVYSFVFVGPTYAGLAQPADGGTGDGYIIPAPYNGTYYATATLTFTF
ncbi:MAG TPA: TonB-dependent receptor [Candidatus Sulfotelmatobacter sp.]|nr:TonB-dependent receptor [Candidatus Sulfotelmatobacter sp.]